MSARSVAALALACLAGLLLALPVMAHASLVGSDPVAGGTLITTPYTLTATFDEELTADGSSIVIEGPNGAEVATGTVSTDAAHTLTAALPALSAGAYTVRWTAVTADDLAVEHGTYTFNVGSAQASGTAMPTPTPAGGATGSGNDLVIAVVLAAIAIGGVLAFIFIRGRR